MHAFFDSLIQNLIIFANQIGYLGIFFGMLLESTIIPIPSELIMIPAGISAAKGGMNIYLVTIIGILGNVSGAIISYFASSLFGRMAIIKFGKYFLVNKETITKIEKFFKNHGPISVFIGRLIPGLRHFISIPAGIAKMNFLQFCFYTTAGSAIWTTVLVFLGFAIGENQELIGKYLHDIIFVCLGICVTIAFIYYFSKRQKL